MPNIIVREYDNSRIVNNQYGNFAVVVPGFQGNADKDPYDNNGIYKCNSVVDFVNNVGCVASKALEAKCAKVENIEVTPEVWRKNIDDGIVYTCDEITETTEKVEGKLKFKQNETWYQLTATTAETDYDAETEYRICLKGNEGSDGGSETAVHYGNQIAYELLNLGYTVLYKKLENIGDLTDSAFWEPLKDKAEYEFRYVLTGLANNNREANRAIYDLAAFNNTFDTTDPDPYTTGRGDCIALLDIDDDCFSDTGIDLNEVLNKIKAELSATTLQDGEGKYGAFFGPFVDLVGLYSEKVEGYNENTILPASFYYLACADRQAESYPEWFATSGYDRGKSIYTVRGTTFTLGDRAINALQPRSATNGLTKAVNLVVKIQDVYYLWGNRTAYILGEDLKWSHFLNIRQLCTTIKKQVDATCKRYTFDANSDVLWINICNELRPMLERMKSNQGIADYKLVKVKSTQKGKLKAKIRIVPIEAVEDFDIGLYLEDSVAGLTVNIEE